MTIDRPEGPCSTPARLQGAEPERARSRVRASYTFAPGSGGTRLESVADFDVRGPMRLLAPLLGRIIQRRHERDLQRPKELLEAEPPS